VLVRARQFALQASRRSRYFAANEPLNIPFVPLPSTVLLPRESIVPFVSARTPWLVLSVTVQFDTRTVAVLAKPRLQGVRVRARAGDECADLRAKGECGAANGGSEDDREREDAGHDCEDEGEP
jgi:hypothetical protein